MTDLTGKKFGRLVVIKQANRDKWGHLLWLCKCNCGKEKIIQSSHLITGHTKSCECIKKETKNLKHGHHKTKTYTSWQAMKQRCTNPRVMNYNNYGGRGIKVCERWRKFENFLEDMGEVPRGLQIERKDNDGNYCQENCHWVTRKQQARNKRNNHLITYNDKQQCLATWAEEYNIKYHTLYYRIYKLGWSIQKALTKSIGR